VAEPRRRQILDLLAGDGRRRMYRLNGYPLKPIHDWVKNYEQSWSQRFDRLDAVLAELREKEQGDGGSDE
jgi:hypothetical protein